MTTEQYNLIKGIVNDSEKTNKIADRKLFFTLCKELINPKIIATTCIPCIKRYISDFKNLIAEYELTQTNQVEVETNIKEVKDGQKKGKSNTKKAKGNA